VRFESETLRSQYWDRMTISRFHYFMF